MAAVPERCALPGCDEPIEQPADGGPRRKFCTAAHRAAARRLRHEERTTVAATVPSPTSDVAVGIPAPRDLPPRPTPRDRVAVADRPPRPHDNGSELEHRHPLVAASHAANTERRRRAKRAAGTRRRGIAVLGAASILAAGGGWVVIDKSRSAVPDTTSVASSDVAIGTAEWASRARVALASLDSQLDLVNQVQAAWNALPEARSGILPRPVVELLALKARLEQQRAMLESELSAIKSLENSRAALTSTESQLASVERALQAIPSGAPLSPEQSQTAQRLKAQRDVLVQQRENQHREVLAWDNSVRSSVTKPLPELEKVTGPVTDNVTTLIDNPGRRSNPPPVARVLSPLPSATNREEWAQREQQDYNTGAPPNPGRPSLDELGQSPSPSTSTRPVERAPQQSVDPVVVDAVMRQLTADQNTGADASARPTPKSAGASVPAPAAPRTTTPATTTPATTTPATTRAGTTTPPTTAPTPRTSGTPATTPAAQPAAPPATPPASTPPASAAPAGPAGTPTPTPSAPVNGSSVTRPPTPATAGPAPSTPPTSSPTPTPRARAASGPATTPTGTTTTTTTPTTAPPATPTTSPPPPATPPPAPSPARTPQPVAT